MENWKHIGALLSGVAALLTAGFSVFSYLNKTQNANIQKIEETRIQQPVIKKQFAIINDSDGWVNMRSSPSASSQVIIKIENGYKVEILQKNGNWYRVKNSIGDVGYIYSDRLMLNYE